MMIELSEQDIEHYYHNYRSFAAVVQAAYRDGYKQAVKDIEHLEDTGVLII